MKALKTNMNEVNILHRILMDVKDRKEIKERITASQSLVIARIIIKFEEQLKPFESTQVDLLKKFAILDSETPDGLARDDAGKVMFETPEKKIEFEKQFSDLVKQPIEFEIDPMKIDQFADLGIGVDEMIYLEKIFE